MFRNVTKAFRRTLRSLVCGEELNGPELWRIRWHTNEGGGMEVEMADLGALHAFPQCTDSADLPRYLDEWTALVQEQGKDLPGRHLTTLLTRMHIVRWLQIEQHRRAVSMVAHANVQRRFPTPPGQMQPSSMLQNGRHNGIDDGASARASTPPSTNTNTSDPILDKLSMVWAAFENKSSDSHGRRRDDKGGKRTRSSSSSRPNSSS